MRVAEEDIDAETAKPRRGIGDAEVGAQAAHPLHHGSEIYSNAVGYVDAEPRGVANFGGGARGTNDRLGRDATKIKAVATHQIALDNRDLRPEPGGARGDYQSRGAGADDDQVVARRGRRIDPSGGMDVLGQEPVMLVRRRDREFDGRG